MKKSTLLLFVILSAASCRIFRMDPFEPEHYTGRYVKNNTGIPLIVATRDFTSPQSLGPGDSARVFTFHPSQKWGTPTFYTHYEWQDENGNGEKQYLSISSADGELLKKWIYGSENMQDERFFKEESWRFYTQKAPGYDRSGEEEFLWVFDILPEDIASEVDAEP